MTIQDFFLQSVTDGKTGNVSSSRIVMILGGVCALGAFGVASFVVIFDALTRAEIRDVSWYMMIGMGGGGVSSGGYAANLWTNRRGHRGYDDYGDHLSDVYSRTPPVMPSEEEEEAAGAE